MTATLFGKYQREPAWRPIRQLRHVKLEPKLAQWLFDSSSLTTRLKHACTAAFSVQILQEGWARPMLNEAERLGMRPSSYAWIRQVHLLCGDQAWVFARTVIPPHTLRGKQRRLARLGKKPLGAVLFADKSMQRTEMEIADIRAGQPLFELATHHRAPPAQSIWGRRSVFFLNRKPLLVSEIFLPEIGDPVHTQLR